jgi:ribosome-associated toxin RatA of RatAB toxin-antitoxin module
MPRVRRSALLPYSAQQTFDLVNDIERYPEFLPWCSEARIVATAEDSRDAQLTISKGRVREHFTTRNVAVPPDSIQMHLVDGPFRLLDGLWRFTSLGDVGCKVELELDFELSNALIQKTLGRLFARATGTMVDAFCVRARAVYGEPA